MYPKQFVGVLGESLGSGPACVLASETPAPDAIALATPFDQLGAVAARHFRFLPARLLLRDNWDNVAALRGYKGEIVVMATEQDDIIPLSHARALADSLPRARWVPLPGGHNDWSRAASAAEALRAISPSDGSLRH